MGHVTRHLALIILSGLLISLSACAVVDDIKSMFSDSKDTIEASPDSLASEALDKFNHGQYSSALTLFGEIQERFPFSRFSLMAELKTADCHYYLGHYTEAIAKYEEFEQNHPTNEAIPYVLFQVAMCHFQQMDTIDRDPGSAVDAETAFAKLIRLYPNSPYTEEARKKIREARNFLAGHELYVARFYIKTEKFEQSEGRLRYLLDTYPDTEVAKEAEQLLARLESGEEVKGSWWDWLPEVGLPDWATFQSFGVSGGNQEGQ